MRGYNKKVFLLKETDSYIFDEALFFVKRDVETSTLGKSDMVIEANRIIEESLREDFDLPRGEGVSFLKRSLIPFFLGALTTALIAFLTVIII